MLRRRVWNGANLRINLRFVPILECSVGSKSYLNPTIEGGLGIMNEPDEPKSNVYKAGAVTFRRK